MGWGRKLWTRERLTVTDLQGITDQTVMSFASASARDVAIPAPVNGMVVWLDSPGVFMERVAGAWVTSSLSAGASGAIVGTAPAAGYPLRMKTATGTIALNSSGDGTLTFPGGAFPNAVLAVDVRHQSQGGPPSAPFDFVTWTTTLSQTNLRGYNGTAVAASLSPVYVLTAIGW